MKINKLMGPPMGLAWFIWGLGALFYLVGFSSGWVLFSVLFLFFTKKTHSRQMV